VARFEASVVSTTYGGEPSVDAALYSGAAGLRGGGHRALLRRRRPDRRGWPDA